MHCEVYGSDRRARARAYPGRAYRRDGRLAEAREQLQMAIEVLRIDADEYTIDAWEGRASVAIFGGDSAQTERLSNEFAVLAQELDITDSRMAGVLVTRALACESAGRRIEAAMYLQHSSDLAESCGDLTTMSMSLLNLSNVLNVDDSVGGADAAQRSIDAAVLSGSTFSLGTSIANLGIALLATDRWDDAEAALTQHGYDLVTDDPFLSLVVAFFRALRGDADGAAEAIDALTARDDSEDVQDQAARHTACAFAAFARNDLRGALEHASSAMTCVDDGLSFSGDDGRWSWPLAARVAHEIGDHGVERSMLELGERQPIGHLARVQRAELLVIRARLAAADGVATHDQFATAVSAHRSSGTPYHLAHALLDQAEFLTVRGDHADAALAISEARDLGTRLRCAPLAERADATAEMAATADSIQ